jgi:branched-chain amino acid transport system substrate-binding protein
MAQTTTARRGALRLPGIAVAAITASAVLLTACGGGSDDGGGSGSGGGSYQVSVISDLTGAGVTQAAPYADGVATALDDVNSKGGVNGKKIEYKTVDTQSDPTAAQAAFRSAISAKPVSILAASGSATLSASFPLLQSAGIPVIAANAIGFPNHPFLYGASLSSSQLATMLANSAAAATSSLRGKKVALVGIDSPATRATFGVVQTEITELGGTVTSSQFVAPGTPSFDSGAANIISQAPDVVVIQDSAAGTILEAKAIASAGFKGPIVVSYAGSDDATLANIANPSLLGVRPYVYATPGTEIHAAAQKFNHAKNVSNEGFVRGWLMGQMLIAGLGMCGGECASDNLIKSLDGLGTFTVPGNFLQFGDLELSPERHHPLTAVGLYSYDPATRKSVVKIDKVDAGDPVYPGAS